MEYNKADGKMRAVRIFIISGLFLALTVPAAYGADIVRVVTKENAVREQCRFFAPVAAKVRYGEPLEVVSAEGDWLRVRFEDTEGCIHKTAITEKKFKKKKIKEGSGDESASGGASSEEVALAGKGFNSTVEKKYRSDNPDMDFADVDHIEESSVNDEAMLEFIEEGGLKQP
jgi:hypothetical protein